MGFNLTTACICAAAFARGQFQTLYCQLLVNANSPAKDFKLFFL